MNTVEVLAQPICRLITVTLAHFLWQGLAVALGLAVLVQLLPIRRPHARYACSLAALGLMVVCPLATFAWSYGEAAAAEATATQEGLFFGSSSRGVASVAGIEISSAFGAGLAAIQPYAFAAWLLGVTLFAGRLSIGLVGVARLRRQLIPLPLEVAASVDRLGRRLSLAALPLVFLSKNVTEALAVGLIRPLVLIPASWATELPLPMLEAVIAHELAHIRRRDLWVNLVQRIVETVLFYHPAVWWLSRRLRTERELCADELAVAATGRRLEYAEALEQVARWRQAEIRPALAAFMRGENPMRVLERVRNVLGLGAAERSRLWPAGLIAMALPLGLWALSLCLATAVADEEREKPEGPRVAREEDDDDREEKEVGRKEERDDDDDDEKEGAREKEGDGDREEGRKEGARDGEVKKEGPRDGEVKKEGPRDGGRPRKDSARDGDRPRKEGPRDGEVKKEGAPDGDRPRKEGARDGERPLKHEFRNYDLTRKEGFREGEGGAIAELKAMVQKLMAENERLRAELASVRGDKEGGRREAFNKERELAERKELEARARKEGAREGDLKNREAAERKEAEVRERMQRWIAEEYERKEGAARKEREAAERKERDGAERKEGDRKEGEPKEGDRTEGDPR